MNNVQTPTLNTTNAISFAQTLKKNTADSAQETKQIIKEKVVPVLTYESKFLFIVSWRDGEWLTAVQMVFCTPT